LPTSGSIGTAAGAALRANAIRSTASHQVLGSDAMWVTRARLLRGEYARGCQAYEKNGFFFISLLP
jgi:hypothetical protein